LPLKKIQERIDFVMPRKSASPHPPVRRLLRELGENIRLARLRRGFSMELVAERAGMSRPTLRAVESGEPGVTIGSYANVLHSLGLHEDLALIARDDALGRKLQDAGLPTRRRAPKRSATTSSSPKAVKKDGDGE
jgi:transcriptional regulator with XRE-family HTH domain